MLLSQLQPRLERAAVICSRGLDTQNSPDYFSQVPEIKLAESEEPRRTGQVTRKMMDFPEH